MEVFELGEEMAVDGKCDRHEWRLRMGRGWRSAALYGDIWLEVISVAR